jgi:hypothetical protein
MIKRLTSAIEKKESCLVLFVIDMVEAQPRQQPQRRGIRRLGFDLKCGLPLFSYEFETLRIAKTFIVWTGPGRSSSRLAPGLIENVARRSIIGRMRDSAQDDLRSKATRPAAENKAVNMIAALRGTFGTPVAEDHSDF